MTSLKKNIPEEVVKRTSTISYTDIANKLLNDKLLLTALEFYTELVESGKDIPQLREFFSNPGNFEQSKAEIISPISRSGSQVTLDSLDLARLSEDGDRGNDERVAVLEFELRKAKETINALRANLTVATEAVKPQSDKEFSKQVNSDLIKPHEQRALNFLINEYLLQYGYKLTSITFADENENQDFEDWDDVGLNIPKPMELLLLYRETMKKIGYDSISIECQVDIPFVDQTKENTINNLKSEIEALNKCNLQLEKEKHGLLKQYNDILNQQTQSVSQTNELINAIADNETVSNNSTSPERFEIIDKPDNKITKKTNSGSIITLEDEESATSLNENDTDWTRVTLALEISNQKQSENDSCSLKSEPINNTHRNLPPIYQKELFSHCFKNVMIKSENSILDEILKNNINSNQLVHILSKCLPRIIPNIILNKREEVIPLLLSAVHLNTSSEERDKLIQQLFNLKKRPEEEERKKILAGIVGIAQCSGVNLIENELLPQCWEQLSHKYIERRLLVIESCIHLAPYISSTIRNSLMLSILQQTLTEDREPSVRELSIQALTLITGLCDDVDKYNQYEDLTLQLFNDPDNSVIALTINLLLPVLAKWSLDIGKFQSNLMKKLLKKLRHLITRSETVSEEKVNHILTAFNTLLPFIIVSIANTKTVISKLDDNYENSEIDFLMLCSPLTNPNNFCDAEYNIKHLIYTFQKMITTENIQWPEFDWFLDIMIQELLVIPNHIEVGQQTLLQTTIDLFKNITVVFGSNFTRLKLKRLFEPHIQNLENLLTNFTSNNSPKLFLIPVYLISILNHLDYAEEVSLLVQRLICAFSLSGTQLTSLEIALRGLVENKDLQETIVAVLWEGVVHQKAVVRITTAELFVNLIGKIDESLLINRVTPAIITLGSDPEVSVRGSTLSCIGSLIIHSNNSEIRDKAYLQLQSIAAEQALLRQDHVLACQFVLTLGMVASSADTWFREEVVFPQLASMALYASQMSNLTRKKDLISKLVEAFMKCIYCPMSKQTISNYFLPGLRYLENIESSILTTHHRESISSMIRDVESRLDVTLMSPVSSPLERVSILSHNVNQGMEDVRQRMSKIFQPNVAKTASNLSNLQGMFKKK